MALIDFNAAIQIHILLCWDTPGIYQSAYATTRLILGLRLANERRRYFVTTSLIGWAQA